MVQAKIATASVKSAPIAPAKKIENAVVHKTAPVVQAKIATASVKHAPLAPAKKIENAVVKAAPVKTVIAPA